MKTLVIEKDRGRLVFTPESACVKIEYGGAGLLLFLDKSDMLELEAALRNARRASLSQPATTSGVLE